MNPRTLSAVVACALLAGIALVLFGRALVAKPEKRPSDPETPAFRVIEAECDSAHGIKIGVANATSKPLPEKFQLTVKGYTKNDAFIMERDSAVAHRGIPVAPTAPVLWPGEEFSFQWPLEILSGSSGSPPAYIQVNILPWIVVKGAGMASVALDRDHPAKIIGDSKIACVAPAASASLAAHKKSALPATIARAIPNTHASLTLSNIVLQNTTRYGLPLSAPASTFDVFKLLFVNWQTFFRNTSPPDSNIKRYRLHATFYGPQGQILGSVDDFETVNADQDTVTFSGKVGSNSGGAFQPGTYTIRFYLDGQKLAERHFAVTEVEKPGSAEAWQIQQDTQRRAQQLDLHEEREHAEGLWAKRLKECWAGVGKWTSEIAETESRPTHAVYDTEQKTERIENLRRLRDKERDACEQMEKSAN